LFKTALIYSALAIAATPAHAHARHHHHHHVTWLAAFMDGSEARWWARRLKAERIYNALQAELRE